MNTSLISTGGNYGAIDAYNYTCHGYYIMQLSSSTYTPQSDLSIYGRVVLFGEMVCEGTFFQSISILIITFFNKINSITQSYL